MSKLFVLLCFTATTYMFDCEALILNNCQIVQKLRRQGFPENKMRDWVCLIQSESEGRTNAQGTLNADGSIDHGLFQINDRYWCNNWVTPGKGCNVVCADLRTDDITKASQCAKKIYNIHGFNAWAGWRNECQGELPDISYC